MRYTQFIFQKMMTRKATKLYTGNNTFGVAAEKNNVWLPAETVAFLSKY